MSKAVRRALGVTAAAIAGLGLAASLTGCPIPGDLENKDRFTALAGGSGSVGPASCERPLDPAAMMAVIGCDYRSALGQPISGMQVSGYCAKGGCHNAAVAAGQLDLTPDKFLVSRLLNVKAAHEITCGTNMPCDPVAQTCAACSSCVAGDTLVSTTNPGTGWIFDKIAQFVPGTTITTMTIGCGDAMPTFNTTGTAAYTQAHKDCLVKFFTELAKIPGTWPCEAAPPAGGSGGGGAGGAAPMAGSGGT